MLVVVRPIARNLRLRRAIVSLLLFLGACLASPCRAAPDAAALRRHLQEHPDDARRRLQLVRVLLAANDAAGAETEMVRLLELKPHLHKVRCKLGVLLWKRGDKPGAIRQWRQVIRQQPGNESALTLLKKAGVEAVQRHLLTLDWTPAEAPLAWELEAATKVTQVSDGKVVLNAASRMQGTFLIWPAAAPQSGLPRVAVHTTRTLAEASQGWPLPQLAMFGLPPPGTVHTRVFDGRGQVVEAAGMDERDVGLFVAPLLVLPEAPVVPGDRWEWTTTTPFFCLETKFGTIEVTWKYELTDVEETPSGPVAVIKGAGNYTFLQMMTLATVLKVVDTVEARIDVKKRRLTSLTHVIARESGNPQAGAAAQSVDVLRLVATAPPAPPLPTVPPEALTRRRPPTFGRPTPDEARAFIRKFYDWLFYGHTDKVATQGLDLENLTNPEGNLGLAYRNVSDDYRSFLVSQMVGVLQRTTAAMDTSKLSPEEMASLCQRIADSFTYRPSPDGVDCDNGAIVFGVHLVAGEPRLFRMSPPAPPGTEGSPGGPPEGPPRRPPRRPPGP